VAIEFLKKTRELLQMLLELERWRHLNDERSQFLLESAQPLCEMIKEFRAKKEAIWSRTIPLLYHLG
jgi:hypothetical protein